MFDENFRRKKSGWNLLLIVFNEKKNLFARFHTLKDRGQVKGLSWSEINRPVIVFCILIILRLFGRKKLTILLQLWSLKNFKEIIDWEAIYDGWPNQLFCQSYLFGHQIFAGAKNTVLTRMFILLFVEKSIYNGQNTNEPRKNPSCFPSYWLVNREPYIGLL